MEKNRMEHRKSGITFRAFLLGVVFSALFAILTVLFQERQLIPTATQIPVLPYVLLLLCVLLVNPLIRLIPRFRGLSAAELLLIFTMGLVSSGIPTFGLAAQLVPAVGNLFNPAWNNEQSEWNRHVVPHLRDRYFLAVDGISEVAAEYAELYDEQRSLRRVFDTASRYANAQDALESARRDVARLREQDAASAAVSAAEREAELARLRMTEAEAAWAQAQAEYALHDETAHGLVERVRGDLQRIDAETDAARTRLAELEEEAFERVLAFRRGLPQELRAFPGFIRMPEDTRRSYVARFQRAVLGARMSGVLDDALDQLASEPERAADPDVLLSKFTASLEMLDAMADAEPGIAADVQQVREREDELSRRIMELRAELRETNARRRLAGREELRALERAIHRGQARERALVRRRNQVTEQRQKLEGQLETVRRVYPLRDRMAEWVDRLEAGEMPDGLQAGVREVRASLPVVDGTWRRYFLGDVPWGQWFGPLVRWGLIIGLTYLVLMTFNVLIFRQWAHHEKLIYPLAELPESLVVESERGGAASPIFRSGLFWTGFIIASLILGFNIIASTNVIPGMERLNLNNAWGPYIENTAFAGLQGGRYHRSHIFFTMIGLAFLIPKKVSFSLWFFAVLSMLQILIMVWSGHGQDERSFPLEWWYILNFRTAQGGGALMVFATVILYKCRRYLLCVFRPRALEGLEPDERTELRVSSFLFITGSAGLVVALWLGLGANPWYCLFAYFVIIVITIGLTRAVAEGGILGFQAWVGPFHFIRTFFGLDRAWTHSSLFAPLMVYYSLMFLDIKTFIAPAMANSLKIREDLRMQRGRFHVAMFASILVAAVVSVAVTVMVAYDGGADVMQSWFHTSFPRSLFSKVAEVSQVPPSSAPDLGIWVGAGAVAMAALLYFRQSAFWLPHPIGMIMLVSPMMGVYWFSILLGWLAKTIVTKYGSKEAYGKARALFIGLIVGELVMVVTAMVVSNMMGINIPVDLNRT